jgi:hypothetical protein
MIDSHRRVEFHQKSITLLLLDIENENKITPAFMLGEQTNNRTDFSPY